MSEEVRFFPKDKFNYSKDGDSVELQFILLSAPSMRHLKHYTPVKQAVMASFFQMANTSQNTSNEDLIKNDNTKEDQESDNKDFDNPYLVALFGWDGDLHKVFENCKKLLGSGVALIDGETKLTEDTINHKMSLDDFERLVGVYIENFIMPSQMKATKNG